MTGIERAIAALQKAYDYADEAVDHLRPEEDGPELTGADRAFFELEPLRDKLAVLAHKLRVHGAFDAAAADVAPLAASMNPPGGESVPGWRLGDVAGTIPWCPVAPTDPSTGPATRRRERHSRTTGQSMSSRGSTGSGEGETTDGPGTCSAP